MACKLKTVLIGVGNTFRGDDGVGIYISRKLNKRLKDIKAAASHRLIDVTESSGEGAGLMSSWEGYDRVYLFDAVMSRASPGLIHRLHASEQQIPSDFFKYSSHAFSLAESVELARVLNRLPNELVVYGVEAEVCGYGETLTPAVKAAGDEVVERVEQELLRV